MRYYCDTAVATLPAARSPLRKFKLNFVGITVVVSGRTVLITSSAVMLRVLESLKH